MITSGWRTTFRLYHRCLNGTRPHTTANRDLSRPFQSYLSASSDPYLNLSIEHHLLQKSSPSSTILFLYVNRPCVVIGRNQNPWTEVNLRLLRNGLSTNQGSSKKRRDSQVADKLDRKTIDLVRRRSGGGTVFHDHDNVNWTVISPSEGFTRDKHAALVVRALRRCGVTRCRVNERHDIVLDEGGGDEGEPWGPDDDTHSTPWMGKGRAVKVSGSAYKLTRGRALHHGTALLDSENLQAIGRILRSPAKGYIESKGVESVSSPVANVGLGNEHFVHALQGDFARFHDQYGLKSEQVDEAWLKDGEIRKGYEELKASVHCHACGDTADNEQSPEWIYLQTPRFSISNEKMLSGSDNGVVPKVTLHTRNGVIERSEIVLPEGQLLQDLGRPLAGLKLHEITDWISLFDNGPLESAEARALAAWFEEMLAPGPE